uniref:Retrovirus-related Pol polyprotein from transposon TNT 1-94 n=1 Tax=Tanacetum cinerariifolium TaxID=118510 RepID=A0A6L2KC99_TANCI|nr:hypothetical protein [Tanacetum cinerariifolium]
MGTVREPLAEGTEGAPHLGPERPRVYSDLSSEEKDRYNADIRATNILIQGLPKDIYTLINHYTDAKDIWDNVKMLLEGSKLTKEDRESQLFVTAVKLNKGLRDSNYDQLYAYLKQHKTHAKENKMILERFSQNTVDPLALMSNVSNQQRQARQVKCYNCNGTGDIARNCTQLKHPQNFEYYKDKMLLMQAQENGVTLDAEQILFLTGGQDNAFDDDVDVLPV